MKSNLGLLRWRYRNYEDGLPLIQEALEIAHRTRELCKGGRDLPQHGADWGDWKKS